MTISEVPTLASMLTGFTPSLYFGLSLLNRPTRDTEGGYYMYPDGR